MQDERVITLTLREGHRWSDGAPFTSEDFRYWWEDVARNEALSPVGPPASLMIEGELPTVTFPDSYTVRFAWSRPNPFFLASLARAKSLFPDRAGQRRAAVHLQARPLPEAIP